MRVAQQDALAGLSPLGVDGRCDPHYLDNEGSVSALVEVEDLCDQLIDEQYRRFHSGS